MFRSAQYQALSPLHEAALDNAIFWPSELILPYKTQTVEFEGGEWLGLLAALCVFELLGADSAKFFAMSLE
ncbi:MAG: hypothetical protein O3C28_02015 [Proteobacteria bacterium]|nr:hypothetical protein [Pseudomonadota bacterium]